MPQPEGEELEEIRSRRERLPDFPGHDHPPFSETIGGVQHIAVSVSAEQFAVGRRRLDEAGIDYLGPDRGVEGQPVLPRPQR